MSRLRVAMIAPPWLKIPAQGYGGVEVVIDGLVKALESHDIDVEVFGVGDGYLHGAKVHSVTDEEQFEHILKPMYDFTLPIASHHVVESLDRIVADGAFDVIHDHNYYLGPSVLSWATRSLDVPPAIHTIHGPPLSTDKSVHAGMPDNRPFWQSIAGDHNCYFVSISDAMKNTMPKELADHILPTVHNAVDVSMFPFIGKEGKKNHFITFARFAEEKGQHIAVKICAKKKYRLRMAGPVATITTNRKLMLEIANPMSKYRNDRDFKYYSDEILPRILRTPRITYSGGLGGKQKMAFLSHAKALLFPITWDEPFGMAVIEALACGTPVIAMNRGAMPEIIEHGVNGFLANNEEEFAEYMARVDEIDPVECRASVERKFSASAMADAYAERYRQVIELKKKADRKLKRKS
ncbi:MAG: glycosyltransferase family 4 protein [Candidatus Saccharimonadales bacterium]